MRRVLILSIVLAGCDAPTSDGWGDAAGIEVCRAVVDECSSHCDEAVERGDLNCSSELYDDCSHSVFQRSGIEELVPGLHVQLTDDVVMGRKPSCADNFAYLAAWRYED